MGRCSPSAPMSVDGDSLQLGQNFTELASWSCPTVVAAEIVDICDPWEYSAQFEDFMESWYWYRACAAVIKGYKFGDRAGWVDVVDRFDGTSRIQHLVVFGEVDHPHA